MACKRRRPASAPLPLPAAPDAERSASTERRRSVGGRYEETIMWYSAVGCIVALALSMLVAPLAAVAQPPAKAPRIGWLLVSDPSAALYLLDAFRQGLRELGWVEG